ncbi:hypothetical protein EU803_14870 [Loktanella sp. IMCC34160]|uniref:hypothetical protein n=1 Tax=Loktanella sp. IMCC34160 TaxID=2510646 RepID=UPI00101B7445|nr:hypothetical protein [Loktanella sp. IMCC34160]RYG89903.1 hypothetical protein EU803_14870 [Loktanella sp. IMCC34160]
MTNDVRKKYPRAAAVTGGLAVLCLVLGAVQAPAFYFFGAWLGLVAVILALGPMNGNDTTAAFCHDADQHNDPWHRAYPGGCDAFSVTRYGDPLDTK